MAECPLNRELAVMGCPPEMAVILVLELLSPLMAVEPPALSLAPAYNYKLAYSILREGMLGGFDFDPV